MKQVFTALGVIVTLDYIADGQLDWTRHSIQEPFDAVVSGWQWAGRQVDYITNNAPSPW